MKPMMTNERLPVLTVRVGDQLCGFLIEDVVEVAVMVALSRTPEMPPHMHGFANRHGNVMPVLDLRSILGLAVGEADANTLFVVVRQGEQLTGLVVDEVLQVEYFAPGSIKETSHAGKYIRGIISYNDRLIQVMAVEPLVYEA